MRLLFVCTHNRCRSILSEAITAARLGDRAEVKSAGTTPAAAPHPATLEQLRRHAYRTDGLFSKDFNELRDFAPEVVITVCDSAAREPCPVWLGNAVRAHWGLVDPSVVDDEEQSKALFAAVIKTIQRRAAALEELIESGESRAPFLEHQIQQIGEIQ